MINAIYKILIKNHSPRNRRNKIKIEEQDNQALVREIIITKQNRSIALVYEFEKIRKVIPSKDIFPFFDKSIKGLCSIADACIFYEYNNKINVIICELKSKKTNDAILQIKNTKKIIEYLLANTTNHTNKSLPVEYKGIIYKYEQNISSVKNISSFKIQYYHRSEDIDFVQLGHLEKVHINSFCN